jgi:hypothetical protein
MAGHSDKAGIPQPRNVYALMTQSAHDIRVPLRTISIPQDSLEQ